jgi:hypothetical protein
MAESPHVSLDEPEHSMNRHSIHIAIAAALFASLALAGCKKANDTSANQPNPAEPAATTPSGDTTPATPPPVAAPEPTAVTVTTVDLGNAIDANNRVTAPMRAFATTDTIHASVATDGPGGTLTAKWTMGDKIVDTQDKVVAPGPQITEFSVSKPDGWPAGHYKLEVMAGGNALQTREFDVK